MSVLLSALSLAGAAASPLSEVAIKDGYLALKTVIVRKFSASNPKLERTLADYADDPKTYAIPAAKVLSDAGVAGDQKVLDQASELLKQIEAARPGSTGGLVGQINAQGGRVLVIGGNQLGQIFMGDGANAR